MSRIKPKEYKGIWYRSGYERNIAVQLDEADVSFTFEEDIITYVVPSSVRKYNPDFKLPNGIYIEAKGRWTLPDRKKMVLVIEQNPKLDIRMLFQRDGVLNKGSKTKYSAWCEKRGIKYAIGKVPKEWWTEPRASPE